MRHTTEASTQYTQSGSANAQTQRAQHEKNVSLAAKLKGNNFTLREQKQGGLINNYFQTSHNQTYGSLGNPNQIRSRIPEQQRADARKEHYYLGFDQSAFNKSMDQTFDFTKRGSGANSVTYHRNNKSVSLTSTGKTSSAIGLKNANNKSQNLTNTNSNASIALI